jgi:hypothetical protein
LSISSYFSQKYEVWVRGRVMLVSCAELWGSGQWGVWSLLREPDPSLLPSILLLRFVLHSHDLGAWNQVCRVFTVLTLLTRRAQVNYSHVIRIQWVANGISPIFYILFIFIILSLYHFFISFFFLSFFLSFLSFYFFISYFIYFCIFCIYCLCLYFIYFLCADCCADCVDCLKLTYDQSREELQSHATDTLIATNAKLQRIAQILQEKNPKVEVVNAS